MLPPAVRRSFLAQNFRRQSQWPSTRWVIDIQPGLLQHDLQEVLHSRHAKVANRFRQSDKALQTQEREWALATRKTGFMTKELARPRGRF